MASKNIIAAALKALAKKKAAKIKQQKKAKKIARRLDNPDNF